MRPRAAAAIALAAIAACAAAPWVSPGADAQVQSPFERQFGAVKYLDAYFGLPSAKMEVRPGDANVPFTVAVANVGAHDITGIRGQLSLPLALSAHDGSRAAVADAEDNANAGETFFLTFYVNVGEDASIGDHPAAVRVDYSRIRESGTRNEFFEFAVEVTGDSVIDASAQDAFITSLRETTVAIDVSNSGTAQVSSVEVTVSNPQDDSSQSMSNLDNVVIRESSWDLGNIGPGGSGRLEATIYVPGSVREDVLRVPLDISYINAQGDAQSVTRVVDFYVRGLIDARIYDVRVSDLAGNPTIVGYVINEGNEDALFGFVTLAPLGGSNLVEATQFIDEIETDSPVPFSVPVEFEGEARYGDHDVRVDVRFKDSTREETILSLETTVTIPEPPAEEEGPDMMLAVLLAAPAAAVAAVLVRRRRARRRAAVQ